jgi:hypothetical protein
MAQGRLWKSPVDDEPPGSSLRTAWSVSAAHKSSMDTGRGVEAMRRMTLGKPDAGKPLVRFDEGRSKTVIGIGPLNPYTPRTLPRQFALAGI